MNKKIGILTYHRSHNYGAFMQCYALEKALTEQLNSDVEVIDYNSKKSIKYYKKDIFRDKKISSIIFNLKKYRMFNKEIKNLKLSKDKLVTDDLNEFKKYIETNKYDCIITGSDEIWKIDGLRGFPNAYWLPNINCSKKISYAASSRSEYEIISTSQKKQIENLLESFDAISVRDRVTKDLIEKFTDKSVELVCDPTFAYDFTKDKEYGKRILREKFNVNPNKKCIGIMVNKKNIADLVKKKYGNDYEIVSLYFNYPGLKSYPKLTPLEWIQVIGALDCFITTFFHGMCFAINFDIPFLTIEQRKIKKQIYSKSYDLLQRNGIEKNYYQSNSGENLENRIDEFIDFCRANQYKANYKTVRESERKMFIRFISQIKSIISGDSK